MKQGYFVKYDGINASVRHQGNKLNPYSFRPGYWVEVDESDFDKYREKAARNSSWSVKEDEVAVVKIKYFARFLGLGKQDSIEISRYDQDNFGQKKEGTERDYVFPKGEWIEIAQIDAAFFLKKSTNDFWEYDKRITTEGVVKKKTEPTVVEPKEPAEPKKKGRPKKEPVPEVELEEEEEEEEEETSEDDV